MFFFNDSILDAAGSGQCMPAASTSTSPCRMASTPSTSSSRAASREPQQKRRRITRDEETDEAICVGLRESSKRWERKAEAESAKKNADMYFGKNVGETLHQMTPRQKVIAKARIQHVLLEVQFPEEPFYQPPSPHPQSQSTSYFLHLNIFIANIKKNTR